MRARERPGGAEGSLPHGLGESRTPRMYAARWSVLVGPEGGTWVPGPTGSQKGTDDAGAIEKGR